MNTIKCIVQKELSRVFHDRKLIVSMFFMPVILMVGIMFLSMKMAESKENDINEHIPVVYIQNEPNGFRDVVNASQIQANIIAIADDEEAEEIKTKIRNGDADLLYVFDEGFVDHMAAYQDGTEPPVVQEYFNSSEDYSAEAQAKFSAVLNSMQHDILVKRFGNDNAITAFRVSTTPIVDQEKATGEMLGQLLPYFVSILMFSSAMGLAIDAIAGEKERGTMASMLLSPAKRKDIAIGKILSLIILSGLSSVIYIVVMVAAFPVMFDSEKLQGLSIHLSAGQIIEVVALLLCMVFMYIAFIALVSIAAKDVKTASSYVSPMYILVMVVGLISLFGGNDEPNQLLYLVPLYGNSLAIKNIMMNQIDLCNYLMNLGSTIVVALLLVFGITKAFNSEKVMFNA